MFGFFVFSFVDDVFNSTTQVKSTIRFNASTQFNATWRDAAESLFALTTQSSKASSQGLVTLRPFRLTKNVKTE